MVSDTGGFTDHSFNELGLNGLQSSAKKLGVGEKHVPSATADDFVPNIQSLLAENCKLIVSVGFNLSSATIAAAKANPTAMFAIVDDGLDPTNSGKSSVANGKPILFDTAEAAFLAGYAAASYSKSGVVGTFGGIQIPPVTIFMDGFVDGVAYFNTVKGKNVKALGWDKKAQTGVFTGGFAAGVEAKNAAQGLLDQGADVLLPVGGPIYQSAAQAIRDKGANIALIGVDADLYLTDPKVKDLLLTSVMKGVDVGVSTVVNLAATGTFNNTAFVGTLANGGVGVAPFHDLASKVDAGLQAELDAIKAKIVSGDLKVTSPATPK